MICLLNEINGTKDNYGLLDSTVELDFKHLGHKSSFHILHYYSGIAVFIVLALEW